MASDSAARGLVMLEASAQLQDARGSRLRARAGKAWAALWPKALAIAIVLAGWQLIHLSGWKKDIFPAPGATLWMRW